MWITVLGSFSGWFSQVQQVEEPFQTFIFPGTRCRSLGMGRRVDSSTTRLRHVQLWRRRALHTSPRLFLFMLLLFTVHSLFIRVLQENIRSGRVTRFKGKHHMSRYLFGVSRWMLCCSVKMMIGSRTQTPSDTQHPK